LLLLFWVVVVVGVVVVVVCVCVCVCSRACNFFILFRCQCSP
jgi:hypothetical protein